MLNINNIYNLDCLDGIKKIADESIDLIVTDPPYMINYHSARRDTSHRFCKPIENDDNRSLLTKIMPELYRVMKPNTAMYMFCSPNTVDFFKYEVQKYFNVKNLIVWVKNNGTIGDTKAAYGKQYEICIFANKGRRQINGKRITDVWSSEKIIGLKKVVGDHQLHQNQKPLELIRMMIEKSSNRGELVLDPFMGSATTAVAAKESGRDYIGFELDKYYYDIAIQRIHGLTDTGQTSIFTDFEEINE
jgi:site-specific DNA-methyltransferase (adenine-specific)